MNKQLAYRRARLFRKLSGFFLFLAGFAFAVLTVIDTKALSVDRPSDIYTVPMLIKGQIHFLSIPQYRADKLAVLTAGGGLILALIASVFRYIYEDSLKPSG